jgi:hypothetical protein
MPNDLTQSRIHLSAKDTRGKSASEKLNNGLSENDSIEATKVEVDGLDPEFAE